MLVILLSSPSVAQGDKQSPRETSTSKGLSDSSSSRTSSKRDNKPENKRHTKHRQPVITFKSTTKSRRDDADPSGFVTHSSVKDAHQRVRNLGDVLRESAGVSLRSAGGIGAFQSLSIRGSSSSQVTILLDGIALNQGGGGVVNLSDIPVDALRSATIFRGFAPAHLGGAIGGVVALRSRYPKGYQTFHLTASAGSYGTFKANLMVGKRWSRWRLLGFAHYLGSDGSFPYFDNRGTPLERNDDLEVTLRRNNASHTATSLLRADYRIRKGVHTGLSYFLVFRDMGVPGIANFRSQTAHFQHQRHLLQAYLKGNRWPVHGAQWKTQLYAVAQNDQFQDLLGEIGLGRQNNSNQSLLAGWNGQISHTWFKRWLVSVSWQLRGETFLPEDKLAPSEGEPTRVRWQFHPALSSTLNLFKQRLTFVASGRLEWLQNLFSDNQENPDGSGVYPTGRLGLRIQPWRWLALKANLGRYVRVPTFWELFGDRGTTIGNPELSPETGWKWDAGLSVSIQDKGVLEELKWMGAFFWTQSYDLIRFVQNSQRTMIAINIDQARMLGVESSLQAALFGWLRLNASFTWMEALNQSESTVENGKQLPGRPVWELSLKAKATSPWGELFYHYLGLGGNFVDRANLSELAPRHIHTVGILLRPGNLLRALDINTPWSGLTLVFEVRNLLDERIGTVPLRPALPNLTEVRQPLSDFSGYPLPGRTFYITVNWNV